MSTDVSQDADASQEVMMAGGVEAPQVKQSPTGSDASSSHFQPAHAQQEFRTLKAVPGAFQAPAFHQQQQLSQQLFTRTDAAAANGSNGSNGLNGSNGVDGASTRTTKASNITHLLEESVPTFTNSRRRSSSFSRTRASSLPVAPKALPLRREQTKLLKGATRVAASPITTDHISQHLHGLSMTSSSPVPTTTATPATTAASVGGSVRTRPSTANHPAHPEHQQEQQQLLQHLPPPQTEAQMLKAWEEHAAWDSRPRAHTLAAPVDTAMETDSATRARRNSRASAKARSRSSRATTQASPSNPDSASEDDDDDASQRPRRVCHNERERSRRKNLRQCFLRCQQVTPSVAHDRNVADRILLQETRDHVIRLQEDHLRLTKTIRDLEFELLVAKDGHPDIFGEDRADTQKLAEHLTRTSIGRRMQGAELLLKAMEETDDALDNSYHGSTEHSAHVANGNGRDNDNSTRRGRGGYTVGRRQRQVTV